MAASAATTHAAAPDAASLTFRPKPQGRPLAPVRPSAAERVALFKADFVSRPQTDAARQYLQGRYGVESSSSPRSPSASAAAAAASPQRGYGPGSVTSGSTSSCKPAAILPAALRHDPNAVVPPVYADMQLNKGLLHLMQVGGDKGEDGGRKLVRERPAEPYA